MPELPDFDDLYVVSDLHMGGLPGFQILRETRRLAGFIRRLSTQTPDRRLALVLNGDVIDTLAEDAVTGYVAMDNAVRVVQDIIERDAFRDIWLALAEFVKAKNRTLVIVIGNHDIELALPAVQRMLVERLAGGKLDARARIEFSTTGAGYPCTVGGEPVYCTHGNEVDAWNYNRYEDLARLGRRLNVRQPLPADEWHPNAGTRMVKEVMNEVKRRYAWIDLLKPEDSAAIGTLLALDPAQARKLTSLASILPTKIVGGMVKDQRLGGPDDPAATAPTGATLERLLGHDSNIMRAVLESPPPLGPRRADDMLRDAEHALGDSLGAGGSADGTLGTWQYMWDRVTGWITGVPREEALRRALLDWLGDDTSFSLTAPDDTSRDILKAVHTDFRFVITGHTHLARAIALGDGRAYFNSGTWIRLIQLTQAMLDDKAAFKRVYDVLEDGKMASLDNAQVAGGGGLVLDRTTAVRIYRENGATRGVLLVVKGDGAANHDEIIHPEA